MAFILNILIFYNVEKTTDAEDGSDSFFDKLLAQVVKNLKVIIKLKLHTVTDNHCCKLNPTDTVSNH